ncbi:RtcB family protein [Anaerovorax odorimutans]|uniref:3'-phosphate/5'-hydroxy nucleic acid ligase n=1 Tax=Anaerovorax odorimutans TaxID=109327 RepID=A0ABT1RR82_9FIRM|nr:RtcB family protein [Anaerovorax odorimutans]MCQ4637709.1 RtcB family protein [Anaerovorax odorimutans]
MIEVQGNYNTALCFCAELEKSAKGQIKAVCDQEVFAGSKLRIMPDVHAGMGCTIGTTMTITDKVVPGMVGVDIGCGMETVRLDGEHVDFEKLDKLIRREIPCGREIRETPHPLNDQIDLTQLRCGTEVNLTRARRSIGTLGGGNHFIEVDQSESGALYLVVHSGSRHIGNEVARYYQNQAFHALCGNARFQIDEMIARMKEEGNSKEIHKAIKALKKRRAMMTPVPKDLAYVEGKLFDDYIHDMKLIQRFAALNRKAMTDVILEGMGIAAKDSFTTIHNYIDTDAMILRKGAVSAKAGEKLLIPINMRDGSLICEGRGNEDWNCSAPHGAGRLMSRKAASDKLSLEEYRKQMSGIYTTCVGKATLDEAPMAYKSLEEITSQITDTARIISRIRPLYNFKAAE